MPLGSKHTTFGGGFVERFDQQQTDNPYRAPDAESAGGAVARSDARSQLATRGARFGAYLIDAILFLVPVSAAYLSTQMVGQTSDTIAVLGVALMAVAGITNLILLGTRAQTVGKYTVGIKIVRAQTHEPASGVRIILGRELVRGAGSSIPVIGGFVTLADHLAIFQGSRQCIHDMIADTTVIDVPEEPDQWDEEWEQTHQSGTTEPSTRTETPTADADDDTDSSGAEVHW